MFTKIPYLRRFHTALASPGRFLSVALFLTGGLWNSDACAASANETPVNASTTARIEVPALRTRAAGVVGRHGRLQVVGAQLRDQHGEPVQLTGMSAHMIQFYPWSAATVDNLVTQYKNTLVRAAMYTGQKGYLEDPQGMKRRLQTIVDAAIANDIYVIIDWHGVGGNPNTHRAEAKEFFRDIAAEYGTRPNVLFEIYNEPTVDWPAIKSYAEEVIPVIRAQAPDSVIIVGTPQYCSQPQAAAADRLAFPNLMYTLHFYCGNATVENDGQEQRDNIARLLEQGLPIFVSEWGTSNHTGDGGPYPATARKWLNFMKQHRLSWANWSLTTKKEGSAFLLPGKSLDGPWTDADLSPAGLFMKNEF